MLEQKVIFLADGIEYDVQKAVRSRRDLIELRNEALSQDDFDWALRLSHVIAFHNFMCTEFWEIEYLDARDQEDRDALAAKADSQTDSSEGKQSSPHGVPNDLSGHGAGGSGAADQDRQLDSNSSSTQGQGTEGSEVNDGGPISDQSIQSN